MQWKKGNGHFIIWLFRRFLSECVALVSLLLHIHRLWGIF